MQFLIPVRIHLKALFCAQDRTTRVQPLGCDLRVRPHLLLFERPELVPIGWSVVFVLVEELRAEQTRSNLVGVVVVVVGGWGGSGGGGGSGWMRSGGGGTGGLMPNVDQVFVHFRARPKCQPLVSREKQKPLNNGLF